MTRKRMRDEESFTVDEHRLVDITAIPDRSFRMTDGNGLQSIPKFQPAPGLPKGIGSTLLDKLQVVKPTSECHSACCCSSGGEGWNTGRSDIWLLSECPHRAEARECNDTCGCDPKVCKNREVSKGNSQRLGEHLVMAATFGIDLETRSKIALHIATKTKFNQDDIDVFINDSLRPALNMYVPPDLEKQTTTINHLKYSLRGILHNGNAPDISSPRSKDEKRIVKLLLKSPKLLKECPVREKGTGIICVNPHGIPENQFIIEYLGDVYPAWRWNEVQDTLKTVKNCTEAEMGDLGLYNIALELPKENMNGYDVMYVDPHLRGSFGSRLSHCCQPNVKTMEVITSDERLTLAMFSSRPIAYGQELAWDYRSVTDNLVEWEASTCLCGHSACRGHYLDYVGADLYTGELTKFHSLFNRMQILLDCCPSSCNADTSILHKHGIGRALLGDSPPAWLLNYSSKIVQFIENEGISLNLENDIIEGIFASRIRDLAIALSRVSYVLNQPNQLLTPPLQILPDSDVVKFLWNSSTSVVSKLLTALKRHKDFASCLELLIPLEEIISDVVPSTLNQREIVLERMISLRNALRKISRKKPCCVAAADLIHLYAHTRRWFRLTTYNSFQSEPVNLRDFGMFLQSLSTTNAPGFKYPSTFITGALAYWLQSNISHPELLLLSSTSGCLALPLPSDNLHIGQSMTIPRRRRWISTLKYSADYPWTREGDWDWVFQEGVPVMGSPMFDSIYEGPTSLTCVLSPLQSWKYC